MERAESLAGMALRRAPVALVDSRVTSQAKRTAGVALLATPPSEDLVRKMGNRNLTVVIPATASRLDRFRALRRTILDAPFSIISRHLRQLPISRVILDSY